MCITQRYWNFIIIFAFLFLQADPLLSSENIPLTVKNVSSDSCCTYGTHYPNRIFVGHLPGKANATDLADFFRTHGTVLEGKVVLDSFGRSRRYFYFLFIDTLAFEPLQCIVKGGSRHEDSNTMEISLSL